MKIQSTSFIFILATTLLEVLSLSYVFDNSTKHKLQLKKNGFQKDSEDLYNDIANISDDFQIAKGKTLNE